MKGNITLIGFGIFFKFIDFFDSFHNFQTIMNGEH